MNSGSAYRWQAAIAWVSTLFVLETILTLAGVLPLSTVTASLLWGAPAGTIIVLTFLHSELAAVRPWTRLGAGLGILGLTMVLAGEAIQAAVAAGATSADPATLQTLASALRDGAGNSIFYVGMLFLGGVMMASGRRWMGLIAMLVAVLGFVMAAAGQPPQNLILLVIWEVFLGIGYWQQASRTGAEMTTAA